jgi:hypothetical protein
MNYRDPILPVDPLTGARAPERPGPERPGPEYPPEWDDEPAGWDEHAGPDESGLCTCHGLPEPDPLAGLLDVPVTFTLEAGVPLPPFRLALHPDDPGPTEPDPLP